MEVQSFSYLTYKISIPVYTGYANLFFLFDKPSWGGSITTPKDKAANKINPLTNVKGYD